MPQQPNLNRPPPTATQPHGFMHHQSQIMPNLQNPPMCVPPPSFTQTGAPPLTHVAGAPSHHQVMRSDQQPFILGATSVPPPAAALSSASYDENFQHVQSLDNGGGSRSASTFSAYGAMPVSADGNTDLHYHLPSSHENFRVHQIQQPPQSLNAPITLMQTQQYTHAPQNFQDRTFLLQQQVSEQASSLISADGTNILVCILNFFIYV